MKKLFKLLLTALLAVIGCIAADAQVLVKVSGVVQSSEDSTTMIPAIGPTGTSSGN